MWKYMHLHIYAIYLCLYKTCVSINNIFIIHVYILRYIGIYIYRYTFPYKYIYTYNIPIHSLSIL